MPLEDDYDDGDDYDAAVETSATNFPQHSSAAATAAAGALIQGAIGP